MASYEHRWHAGCFLRSSEIAGSELRIASYMSKGTREMHGYDQIQTNNTGYIDLGYGMKVP
jgi:hypothetical protein